ncbi:tryptophan 7-halogenase [Luteimonas sp. MJ293]|uniref:NAD(P)/FAD-dependent oxidoreductase n=1 Tax=Luteimonas sp. MJ146 TaxID=3129240 RepID=UPI0031BB0CC5
MHQASPDTDVLILGGGLAGLTLALQLHRQDPALRISILERRSHPVAEAAHKVGESTVEIGAHYFSTVLGLREHLDAQQIRKFGFRFFFSDGRSDVDACTELGVSSLLPTPSWQIDRGRFENFLGEHVRGLGIDFRDGTVVRSISVGEGESPHGVSFAADGGEHMVSARWLVDASGRAGLLKRKLGLAESNDHDTNAVWWRVEGIVDPAGWSEDVEWLQRCDPPERWRSTNHMCGPGYWLWLIPLASGAHSVGIVCDAKMHPLETMNTHDKAMQWLRRHQPRVAASLDSGAHAVKDFLFLRHFSHACQQQFSTDRWAITGDAGLFLDPFYSPGSDYIAIANTFICDLVARDRAGGPVSPWAGIYQQLYRSFYDSMLPIYQGQYALFGDARVMPVKVIWDYTYYWALLAPLFFSGRITDLGTFHRLRKPLLAARALNEAMQPMLREWGERNAATGLAEKEARLLDQASIDWFHALNRALSDELDDATFDARMQANVERMRWLAGEILQRARNDHADIGAHGLEALTDSESDSGTPVSLEPHWYAATA